jgi:hypothetical protein
MPMTSALPMAGAYTVLVLAFAGIYWSVTQVVAPTRHVREALLPTVLDAASFSVFLLLFGAAANSFLVQSPEPRHVPRGGTSRALGILRTCCCRLGRVRRSVRTTGQSRKARNDDACRRRRLHDRRAAPQRAGGRVLCERDTRPATIVLTRSRETVGRIARTMCPAWLRRIGQALGVSRMLSLGRSGSYRTRTALPTG